MRPLTPRQAEILQLLKDYQAESGMPPTRAEIALQLGPVFLLLVGSGLMVLAHFFNFRSCSIPRKTDAAN